MFKTVLHLFLMIVRLTTSSKPHWPWMGPTSLEGHMHAIQLGGFIKKMLELGAEHIDDLPFVTQEDLKSMNMSVPEIARFMSGVNSIRDLSESIEYVFDWQPLIEMENTKQISSVHAWSGLPFFQVTAFLDQSVLVIDEEKSLSLTEIRSLQTMKALSNQMTRLIDDHFDRPLSELTVKQVLNPQDEPLLEYVESASSASSASSAI